MIDDDEIQAAFLDQRARMQEHGHALIIRADDPSDPTLLQLVVSGRGECQDVLLMLKILGERWNAQDEDEPADS